MYIYTSLSRIKEGIYTMQLYLKKLNEIKTFDLCLKISRIFTKLKKIIFRTLNI